MKIGITFFGSKLDLLCISKVLTIFCVFSKIRLKRNAPGDTWRARRVRGSLSVWGSRGTAHSESSREGLSGLGHAVHVAGSGASGGFSRLGTRGHVARSAAPGENPTRWTRGALGCFREGLRLRHSGSSGESLNSRCTRGQVARSEGGSERGFENGTFRRRLSGWVSGQVSYSEGFRRRFQRRLRRGHSEGIQQGFGTTPKEFRDTRRAPKASERGCFGVAFEGASGEIFRKGFREGLRVGFRRGGLPRGCFERFPKGGVFEGGCEGVFERRLRRGSSGRVLRAGFGRWIEDLRPGWAS